MPILQGADNLRFDNGRGRWRKERPKSQAANERRETRARPWEALKGKRRIFEGTEASGGKQRSIIWSER